MIHADGGGVVLIYTTAPNAEAAESIAAALVRERLAACVNLIPGMTSVYEWQGKMERADEIACLIKTTRRKAELAMERVSALHPYEKPAILQFEADVAANAFARWVAAQTDS
jgi:periplasmic divalent cation tolerance protein